MATSRRTDPQRVFVASPSDVRVERDSMPSVINELNHTLEALVPHAASRLELVRWETHSFPGMGRPQGLINEQIGEFDIFVGILWQRFGTPTGKADSGTEEEFRRAYEKWLKEGRPHILLYFNVAQIAPPRTTEAVAQLSKMWSSDKSSRRRDSSGSTMA